MKRIAIAFLLATCVSAHAQDTAFFDQLFAQLSKPKASAAPAVVTNWVDPNSYVYLVEYETTNTTAFLDTSGNNRHWSWEGTPVMKLETCGTNINGRIEQCTTFGGANDLYRLLGETCALFSTGSADLPFSIGYWLNITSYPAASSYDIVFSRFYSTKADWAYDTALYTFNSGTNYFEFKLHNSTNNVGRWYVLDGIATNTWHHYVFTYNGCGGVNANTGMVCYIDGAVTNNFLNVSNGTYAYMDTTDRYMLMKGDSAGTFYNGKMDGFFVSSNELSAASVLNITKYTHPTNNVRQR